MNQDAQVNLERAIRIEAAVEQLRLVVDGGAPLEPQAERDIRDYIRALRSVAVEFRQDIPPVRQPRKRKAAKV